MGNRGNRTEQSRRWRNKNRVKFQAQRKLNYALFAKRIIRPNVCSICGKGGLIMGHHHDYSKPLDVIWVCWVCHEQIHSKKEG